MTLACLGALWASAAIGGITGGLITFFGVPPFIVTLGMMLMASGAAAYLLSGGESVYQVPDRFVWLGRGTTLGGLPIAVLLMILLYLLAHFMMGRTRWGLPLRRGRQRRSSTTLRCSRQAHPTLGLCPFRGPGGLGWGHHGLTAQEWGTDLRTDV